MYCIKVTKDGKRASWFLSSGGGMNRLRIHAVQFETKERAQELADEITRDNPGITAKVVEPWKPKKAAAICAAVLLVAGTIHATESKYFIKSTHLGPGAVAVSCLNGGDPTVAGNVGGALIVSCGTR